MNNQIFKCYIRLYDLDKDFMQLSKPIELPFAPYVNLEIGIEKDFDDFDKDGVLKIVSRNKAGTPIETIRVEKVMYRPDEDMFMLFCSLDLIRLRDFERDMIEMDEETIRRFNEIRSKFRDRDTSGPEEKLKAIKEIVNRERE